MRFFVSAVLILCASMAQARDAAALSEAEIGRILTHGPWPPPARRDPGNRVSGKPEAIAFGERLFFEPRLSGTGSVLCATCHVPFRRFQDARPRGFGLEEVDRNTPSLMNVGAYRWYGWDGGNDSLWAQSIRPLLDPREMRASPSHIAGVLRTLYAAEYEKAFGRKPPTDDAELLVDAGKALAAYEETLVTKRTPFDEFRDSLLAGQATSDYPLAARRGLKIFVGKGKCSSCHSGPHFTNGEFADTGISRLAGKDRVDPGRYEGIKKVRSSPYNLLGRFNDDATRRNAVGTEYVTLQQRNFGEFRIPGLRNVARTAPYMHDGSLATLRDVVTRYSDLGKPGLSPGEIDDLVAFLESLNDE